MQGRVYMERPYVSETYDCFYFRSTNFIVVSLSFFPREEWKVTKGRSGRPGEKGPVGGASCRSVCNSQWSGNSKECDRATGMPGQYKLQDAAGRPACCGTEEPHLPFF